jgi:ABC-2 type transport system permease protein
MLGVFPFVMMFLVTSIAMLREQTSGTLERLLTTPISKVDLLFGYGLAYSLVAAAQAIVTTLVAFPVLGLSTRGSVAFVIVMAVADAILGVALGLLSSAFARTEFQVMQMMTVVILPQFFVCGLLVPRDEMAGWMQGLSTDFPLSYAVDAMLEIGVLGVHPGVSGALLVDIGIVLAAAVASLGLAAQTLRRRSA